MPRVNIRCYFFCPVFIQKTLKAFFWVIISGRNKCTLTKSITRHSKLIKFMFALSNQK